VSGSPSASISGSPAASPTPSGSSSPAASAANLSLLVTGNLTVSNTQLACGGLAVGGQLTGTPTFGQANAPNLSGSAGISSSNLNLASLRTQLLATSNELCSLSATGRLSLNNGIAVFDASASGRSNSTSTSASSTSSLNSTSASVTLFTLPSADLANLTSVLINGTQTNGIVIINVIDQSAPSSNIAARNLTLSGFGTNVGSLNASHLLWNFCNASNIEIDNILLLGTILAPRSAVNITRAELEGSLIAESLTGNFFNQIPLPFAGNFCPTASASPSPSTSASPATSSSSPAASPTPSSI
jgi:choice-of-anchor A domain-containing protein